MTPITHFPPIVPALKKYAAPVKGRLSWQGFKGGNPCPCHTLRRGPRILDSVLYEEHTYIISEFLH